MIGHFEYLYSVLESHPLDLSQVLSINIPQGWGEETAEWTEQATSLIPFLESGYRLSSVQNLARNSRILLKKGLFLAYKKLRGLKAF